MNSYSRQEVYKHNKEGDIWLVIHNSVYDVSEFILEHPGGEEVFFAAAGEDASECFDDVGHSADAKQLMKRYKIGEIGNHPGGEEVLLEQSGKDATEPFEDVGHSSDARELMAKYKIGELVESERKEVKQPAAKDWNADSDSESSSSWKSWIISITIGIAATILYRFFLASSSRE